MADRKPILGRNLDDLMTGGLPAFIGTETAEALAAEGELRNLSINVIDPGQYQPRTAMDSENLQQLSDSIRSQGIIQPLVVRLLPTGRYEIIAGERRWRAAKMAELTEVPVVVRDISDQAALAIGLIENLQREDLNPIDQARALQRLADEFALTHQQVATAVGKHRSTVSNMLRLLELSAKTQELLERGDIEMGHARALLTLEFEKQSEIASMVAAKGLTVRETEAYVKQLQQGGDAKPVAAKPVDPDVMRLQNNLSDLLQTKVNVKHSAKGKGQVVIHYNSVDELDKIVGRFKDEQEF